MPRRAHRREHSRSKRHSGGNHLHNDKEASVKRSHQRNHRSRSHSKKRSHRSRSRSHHSRSRSRSHSPAQERRLRTRLRRDGHRTVARSPSRSRIFVRRRRGPMTEENNVAIGHVIQVPDPSPLSTRCFHLRACCGGRSRARVIDASAVVSIAADPHVISLDSSFASPHVAPVLHAKDYKWLIRKSTDNQLWVSLPNKKGVFRWKRSYKNHRSRDDRRRHPRKHKRSRSRSPVRRRPPAIT